MRDRVSNDFDVITEEFCEDLSTIRSLVDAFSDPQKSAPKPRIAAANSATLLLAATFEEFVREMARTHAKSVVAAAESFAKLPPKLANIAWRRTMEALARLEPGTNVFAAESKLSDAFSRFSAIYEFCKGDISKDVYGDLIHNENNMRPKQINALFGVSDLKDVCLKSSDKNPLLEFFGETESGKAHGKLLAAMENFFERRNAIAHSLNADRSSGPEEILKDIEMLDAFGRGLCETLKAPASTVRDPANKRVSEGIVLEAADVPSMPAATN